MIARIRKAVIAGLGAGMAAFVAALAAAPAVDQDEVTRAVGVALLATAATAWATWRVPNATA